MNLHLPNGYVSNLEPKPCNDDAGGPEWQVGVYDIAKGFGLPIVDIGCGRARKLQGYAPGFVGVDREDTVLWLCRERPEGRWSTVDLELAQFLPLDTAGKTIVCSDVIEHLVNPEVLLRWLAAQPATVVLSTPDREKWRGPEHNGPPPNTEHVREWKASEFGQLVVDVFARPYTLTHTASYEGGPENTITVVVRI